MIKLLTNAQWGGYNARYKNKKIGRRIMEKQQTIDELYALRAGLSVVSQKKDEVLKEKQRVKKWVRGEYDKLAAAPRTKNFFWFGYDQKIDKEEYCDDSDKSREENYANYTKWLISERGQESIRKKLQEAKQIRKSYLLDHSLAFTVAVIAGMLVSLAIAIAVIWVMAVGIAPKVPYLIGVAVITSGVFLAALIYLCKALSGDHKDTMDHKKRLIAGYQALLDYIPVIKEEKERIEKQKKQNKVSYLVGVGDTVYSELENTFCRMLDPRDWKYLDLILYYFETGRADTMKEALQLVEHEVQTQRIVGAINTASAQICKTITQAAAAISSQLETISLRLAIVAAQQQIQIAQNQRLIAAADMQNALIKKANTTSEQLMADASYIKNYGVSRIG